MLRRLLRLCEKKDSENKFKQSDMVTKYLYGLAHTKENPREHLISIRETFLDFITDRVLKDFERDGDEELTPQNLVDYYFDHNEQYENPLNGYDLSSDCVDGILSDDGFVNDLAEEPEFREDGPIIKHGEF